MGMQGQNEFLQKCEKSFRQISGQLQSLPVLRLDALEPSKSALIVVDMVNGFAKQGALSSPRVLSINQRVASLARACRKKGIPVLAFADTHTAQSAEFSAFPPHCLGGTPECALTSELVEAGVDEVIHKNSTNGFLEPAFTEWLGARPGAEDFVVTGDCTDLCVLQFALTLKAHFNRVDRPARVIVPASLVETYDLAEHDGDVLNAAALYLMKISGVEVIKEIVFS